MRLLIIYITRLWTTPYNVIEMVACTGNELYLLHRGGGDKLSLAILIVLLMSNYRLTSIVTMQLLIKQGFCSDESVILVIMVLLMMVSIYMECLIMVT